MTTKKPTGRPARKTTETARTFHESITSDPANLRYAKAKRAAATSRKGQRRG